MCRLFATISTKDVGTEFRQLMRPFQKQAAEHPDGWGFGFYSNGAKLVKKPESAYKNVEFLSTAEGIRSKIIIVHIRKASKGKHVLRNTHPFQYGNWTFAHNGTICNIEEVKSALPEEYKSKIKGDTDSEVFFYWLVYNIDKNGAEEGIKDAIEFIERVMGPESSSLNFLLTNGKELFAYRKALKKWAEYTLHYLKKKDVVIVSSDPLSAENWKIIPNGELLTVREDLSMGLNVI